MPVFLWDELLGFGAASGEVGGLLQLVGMVGRGNDRLEVAGGVMLQTTGGEGAFEIWSGYVGFRAQHERGFIFRIGFAALFEGDGDRWTLLGVGFGYAF